jgi:hypothetical protein
LLLSLEKKAARAKIYLLALMTPKEKMLPPRFACPLAQRKFASTLQELLLITYQMFVQR